MKLDVRVEASPDAVLTWLKEWHPIVESARIKFHSEGPYLRSLVIDNAMWRDSGVYTCTAYNDAGSATTSCSIIVEGKQRDFRFVSLHTPTICRARRLWTAATCKTLKASRKRRKRQNRRNRRRSANADKARYLRYCRRGRAIIRCIRTAAAAANKRHNRRTNLIAQLSTVDVKMFYFCFFVFLRSSIVVWLRCASFLSLASFSPGYN